ncbi:C-X-C chemokine receptor type 1 [Clupea harengus]|uniref:C-X-C chemokine receptor type 1 n=1 Tax=Clupea harengus TaxID=7950 RepID=A0A6P3W7R6_CLUHA|nr:C-X-C chemokine receptor type 1 [Clupea harengus]
MTGNSTMYGDDYPVSDFTPCERPSLDGFALMITYFIVFILSLLGNSVVVFVVCSMVKRRTSTDVYLMHLAVADLLFSLTLPFWAVSLNSEWVFGTFLCKLLSGIQDTAFYSCVFLLACISIDRYLAIVKATQAVFRRRHLVKAVCGLVWLAATLLALPSVVQREAFMPVGHYSMVCHENLTENMDSWRTGMRVTRHTLGFFLPLLIMLVCYGCTVCTLSHARNSQKHKAMRVILSVVLAFLICWLPINVTFLVDTLVRSKILTAGCDQENQVDLALQVTEVLAFLHCAINPILYAFIGKKFRNQLLHTLYQKGVIGKYSHAMFRKGSQTSISSRVTSITL